MKHLEETQATLLIKIKTPQAVPQKAILKTHTLAEQ